MEQLDELIEILNEIHPEVDYGECDTLMDGQIFDSFDIASSIAGISERFDVTISPEHIVPQNFNSAKSICALIQKLEEED